MIRTVTVRKGLTVSMPGYESARFDIELTGSVEDGRTPDSVYEYLTDAVSALLAQEVKKHAAHTGLPLSGPMHGAIR